MPVLSQTPVITYTANGSVTTFAFPFQILNAIDLQVFVDSVQTTNFTISGVGVAAGGSITFPIPPINGARVRLVRVTSISRQTDYVEGGAIPAANLDADFDRTVMMIQEFSSLGVRENAAGFIDLTNRRMINVSNPVNAQDGVNKQYIDGLVTSIENIQDAVVAAQTAAAQAAASAGAGGGSSTIYMNVKAFGAVGNGIADDTVPIQNCLNAGQGRGVFIPEGTYLISSLSIPSNTLMIGYGATSILKTKDNSPDQTWIVKNSDFVNGNSNIRLFNFTLDGNGVNQTLTFNNCCTQFKKVTNLRLENMIVKGGISEGIYMFDCPGAIVANNDILSNGRWQDDGSGIHLESCDSAIVNNNRTTANGFHGIILTGVTNSVIANNNCYLNGYDGIRMQWACQYNTVVGNSCMANTRFGLYLGQDSSQNSFTGNSFSGNDVNGIQTDSSGPSIFTGNMIINNSNSGVTTFGEFDSMTWCANQVFGNLYLDWEDEWGGIVQKNYGDDLFEPKNAALVKTNTATVFTAQVTPMSGALVDAASVVVNANQKGHVMTLTLAGNRAMAAPTQIKQYATYTFRITQDATGSRTLTWDAAYKFGGAGAPTLTTTAGKTDIITFIGGAGNTLECTGVRLNAV